MHPLLGGGNYCNPRFEEYDVMDLEECDLFDDSQQLQSFKSLEKWPCFYYNLHECYWVQLQPNGILRILLLFLKNNVLKKLVWKVDYNFSKIWSAKREDAFLLST